jgi:hypothetical protein
MQITITEENDNEGETFGYILELSPELVEKFKEGLADWDELVTIEENTSYTKEDVEYINKHSSNNYMDRIGFYEFNGFPKFDFDFYENIVYKGVGFKHIK